MRVLCSATGASSHAHEMIPLARALSHAGHEVLMAGVQQVTGEFTAAGLRAVAALPDQSESWTKLATSGQPAARDGTWSPSHQQIIDVVTGRTLIGPGFASLRRVAAEFAPDLILRDGMEFCGCLVAEDLGVPQVSTPSGATNTLDPAALAIPLNKRRTELGLRVQDDPFAIYRHGRIDSIPPRYSFAVHRLPDAMAYQQPETVRGGTPLPAWVAELDPELPLVYAAIGAALPMVTAMREGGSGSRMPADPVAALSTIVAALSELDCAAIVSTGGVPTPGLAIPGHVRLVEHVPQPLLLQTTRLFVTHGGYNSVREAMRAGVPMVVVPLVGDQFDNARKVAELGLGEDATGQGAEGVASTCRKVLHSPEIDARVRHAQRELLALPRVDELVPMLEVLATDGRQVELRHC